MAHTKHSQMYDYFADTKVMTSHEPNKVHLFVTELANTIRAAALVEKLRRGSSDVEGSASLWNAKEYLHLKVERMVKDEPFLLHYLIEYSKGYFEDACNR